MECFLKGSAMSGFADNNRRNQYEFIAGMKLARVVMSDMGKSNTIDVPFERTSCLTLQSVMVCM